MTLDDRLTNWGACYRARRRPPLGTHQARSVEGGYRNRWRGSWDCDPIVGTAPTAPIAIDWTDARIIDGAWQAMPSPFEAYLLAAVYVKQWSDGKAIAEARIFAGQIPRRHDRNIAPYLTMAKLLLAGQLAIPAVVRRPRVVARIRAALDLPQTIPAITLDASYASAL
jgi:hypothetical protein